MIKNSPLIKAGWVQINHRPGVNNIVNSLSLPDSNHNWNKKFFVLEWMDEDWGEFFETSFHNVVDNPNHILQLSTSELYARDALIRDCGQTHFRHFVNERKLAEAGISNLPLEGIYFKLNSLVKFVLIQYFFVPFQLLMLWMRRWPSMASNLLDG